MKIDFTLQELLRLSQIAGAEIDIINDELDDPRNQNNLSIDRGEMLKEFEFVCNIREKLEKAIARPSGLPPKSHLRSLKR
jgi:hypothetical protein